MDLKKSLIIIILFLLVPTVLAITLTQDVFKSYRVLSSTGDEDLMFNVEIKGLNICFVPKIADGTEIEECVCLDKEISMEAECKEEKCTKRKLYFPNSLNIRDKNNKFKTSVNKAVTDKFCYNVVNPLSNMFLKFGEESVIILGDNTYNSTDTNVTQENSFAHLTLNDSDIVLYMPFDEGITSPNWTAGQVGNALEFDGVDDYVDASAITTGNIITASVWVKANVDNSSIAQVFVNNYDGTDRVNIGSSGTNDRINLIANNTLYGYVLGIDWDDGSWHHLAYTFNSTNFILYFDGNNYSMYNTADPSDADDQVLRIGAITKTTITNFFNGTIDQVAIWNRSLTANEINITYQRGLAEKGINITNDLVSYWTLNESSGITAFDYIGGNNGTLSGYSQVTYDYSSSNNDGTLKNTVTFTENGKYGGAFEFDGVDDWVGLSSSDSVPASGNFTISGWVKPNTNHIGTLISNNNNQAGRWDLYGIHSSFGNSARFWSNGAGILTGSTVMNDSNWHHIVVVRSGDNWELFIDANSEDTNTSSGSLDTSNNYRIGINVGNNNPFNGTIDEVAIWNRSLTADEILDLYNNQSSKFYNKGEMLFQNIDLGTNESVNITLAGCGTLKGSYLSAKFNNLPEQNFSSCNLNNYNISSISDRTDLNMSVLFYSGDYNFYSPIIKSTIRLFGGGNITAEPEPPVIEPSFCKRFVLRNKSSGINVFSVDCNGKLNVTDSILMNWNRLINANISNSSISTEDVNRDIPVNCPSDTFVSGWGDNLSTTICSADSDNGTIWTQIGTLLFPTTAVNINISGDLVAQTFNGSWNGSVNYPTNTQFDNATIIRNHNISWLNLWYSGIGFYTDDNFSVSLSARTNLTYDAELDNDSIIRNHNTSWFLPYIHWNRSGAYTFLGNINDNVSIGVSDSSQMDHKFTVAGDGGPTQIDIMRNEVHGDAKTIGIINFEGQSDIGAPINYADISGLAILDDDGSTDGALAFNVMQGGSFGEAMRIDDDLEVGIGTTDPKNKLDVEGGAVIGAAYSGTNTAPSNGLLIEGNVGIGTISPTSKLHIIGDLNVTGTIYNEISPNKMSVSIGTLELGGVENLSLADDNLVKVAEAASTPAMLIELNFTVANEPERLYFIGRYEGSATHELEVQVLNFSSGSYIEIRENIRDLKHTSGDINYFREWNFPLPNSNYVNNNIVSVRINHTDNGNSAHNLYMDKIWITE